MLHTATGYWIEEAGAPEPCAPLEAWTEADVVVIGGGYLGMWTAWHVLERDPGATVVLLERERCGFGPSGRNGGFVNGYWDHVPELARRFGLDPAVRLAREADASIRAIGEFLARGRVDAWYRAVPQVQIATAAAQDGTWREELLALRALGHGDELVELSPRQVQDICASPVFRGAAAQRTAATVQPARLAFALRAALLKRGVQIHEDSEVRELEQRRGKLVVKTRAGRVTAPAAVLAVNWRTLGWPAFGRELSAASSHIVLTEPVPDVLAEVGWTGGEALADCRRMLHYFRTTPDGRIAFGWGGGRMNRGARHDPHLDVDPEVIERTAATLRRFFPALEGRDLTHAWGGPIDVAPNRLPIYRSSGALHAGWGFTGHGVGPSHLGGRILSGLALGVRDEVTTLPLVAPPKKHFPPEPFRATGGALIRSAFIRKDELDERGAPVDPVTRAITKLPKLLGMNLPR
ncbi:MAG: FAD-binding oxidoreductase [Solirubrobacteraceae bacterium]|jgi:glycine/D-amino acid oxidase-like deaminating enzyme|nr:FAD-binding oxidoreductase [Solirubrobacteraceae bacterium]